MTDRRICSVSSLYRVVAAALSVWSAAPAQAADPDADGPHYEAALYIWGTGASGTIATNKASKDFDADFSDILDVLNIAAMGMGQVRWGRWVGQLDAFYSQVEDDAGNGSVHVNPGPGPGVDVIARAKAELDELYVDLKAGYNLLERPLPDQASSDPRRYGLDFLLGARWWYIEPTIDVRVGPFAGNYDDSEAWVDGLVGLQAWVDLTPRLRLTAAGDIGGFSIGSASDRSWKATASLRWKMTEKWNAYLAYRGMYIDHPMGSNADLELRHYGPVLGVGLAF